MYTPTPFSQAFARPAPEFQPPASRTSLAERRTIRSSGTADALILALSAAANRGDMDAVLIADDDGMLVCNSVSRLDLAPVAAVVPILEEAGGRFTDLGGKATPWGGSGVATNGKLHDEVVACFVG